MCTTAVLAVFPTPTVVAMLLPSDTPTASTSTTTSSGLVWMFSRKAREATGTSSDHTVTLTIDSHGYDGDIVVNHISWPVSLQNSTHRLSLIVLPTPSSPTLQHHNLRP